MVRGLERFREYFRDFSDSYVLIGGVACEILFNSIQSDFRLTDDFDLVVIVDKLQGGFGERLKEFIRNGGYKASRRKSTNRPTFFRFVEPAQADFPKMIELAATMPMEAWSHHFAPLDAGDDKPSLSAIVFDADYYDFICKHRTVVQDLGVISFFGLVPLKALAFEELSRIEEPTEKKISLT